MLNSREDGWELREKEKGKSHVEQIAVLGIALRQGNRFATACKTAKVEETWQQKTDSKGLQENRTKETEENGTARKQTKEMDYGYK